MLTRRWPVGTAHERGSLLQRQAGLVVCLP
jgi:hypothetical protein